MVADLLLLATASIWGFAFVAQRVGMEYIGPFTYNGIRFLLGAATLLPAVIVLNRRRKGAQGRSTDVPWLGGIVAGLVLFTAASAQQIGLVYTTAGNAGFITGLYVVFVPLLGLLGGRNPGTLRWVAVLIAVLGLYLLSVQRGFTVNPGDVWVLVSAFFFAVHVQLIGNLAGRYDPLEISILQYSVVGIASMVAALVMEDISMTAIHPAVPAILYGGLGSITIAYTLQVVAQRRAEPTHAAILLSLEGTFAALGGRLLLSETSTPRALVGCALILFGMLVSQLVRRSN